MNQEKHSMLHLEDVEIAHITYQNIYPQILASNAAFFFIIHCGVNLAFSNLLVDAFDTETSSWLASIVALATAVGAVISGPIADYVGRKRSLICLGVPVVISWIAMSWVEKDQIYVMGASRILSGISGGMTSSTVIYVSEISHKKYRSTFLSLLSVYFSFGILLTAALGTLFSWKGVAACFAIVFSAALLAVAFVPESPLWLAHFKGNTDAAKKALKALNPDQMVFESEWRCLQRNRPLNPADASMPKGGNDWLKPALLLVILMLLQQGSGIYPVTFYATSLFPIISHQFGCRLKSEAFVLFGLVRFVMGVVATGFSVKFGRRQLLVTSSLGMVFSCLVICLCTLNYPKEEDCSAYSWMDILSLTGFLAFVGTGSMGVLTIPWSLAAELLPYKVRAVGSTAFVAASYVVLFAVTKTFPWILARTPPVYVFGTFAAISAALAFFTFVFIPETLGKSFEEIRDFFRKTRQ